VGCDTPLGSCSKRADLTGHWTITIDPFDGDAGVMGDVIPRSATLDADLMQVQSNNVFGIGASVWGTITSRDKGFFDSITIPQLKKNNGNKTGAELGCTVKINVPIATPVRDDNTEQGPLRIALAGQIIHFGQMQGDLRSSTVILAEDPTMTPRRFAWTATQP
jgi:hypothetical protein